MEPISRRTAVLGSLGLTGAALGLGACGIAAGDDQGSRLEHLSARPQPTHAALVEAAQREGRLTIYTAVNVSRQKAISNAFTKKYGIKIALYRLLGSEIDHKVYAEKMAGVRACDVISGTNPPALEDFRERGWLQQLVDQERSSSDIWPEKYWNGFWATAVVNFQGISYNSLLVPPDRVPKSWDDLLDPFWTGKLLLFDPRGGIQSQILYDLLLKVKGVEFLRKLRAQGTLMPSGPPGLQAVGAGAALAFCPVISPAFEAAKATGMPIEIVFPDLKSHSAIIIAALAGCPHPNAAKLYVDFTMTKEGQAQLNGGSYSPLDGVPGTKPLPGGITPPDYEHTAAHTYTIIEALT